MKKTIFYSRTLIFLSGKNLRANFRGLKQRLKNRDLAIFFTIAILFVVSLTSCSNIDDAIDITQYGNWCGPFYSGEPETMAIDSLDEQCRIHDICYDAIPVNSDNYYKCASGAKFDCDSAIVNNLKALNDNPDLWLVPPTPENRTTAIQYRIFALDIFGACINLFE